MTHFKVAPHFALTLGTILCAATAHADTSTLPVPVTIVNGDFEGGFTNDPTWVLPKGWSAVVPGGHSQNTFGNIATPAGAGPKYFGLQYLTGWGYNFVSKAGIYQEITGLTVGATYALTFWSMADHTPDAKAVANWNVTFGDQTLAGAGVQSTSTPTWTASTLNFQATDTKQTLKFMANFTNATPGATPIILNLDGISMVMTAVPEPATMALMLGGLGAVAFVARRRQSGTHAA